MICYEEDINYQRRKGTHAHAQIILASENNVLEEILINEHNYNKSCSITKRLL